MTTTNALTSPTTRLLTLADGRTIAVDSVGPDDGPTVVFLHAAPGSRRFDPAPAVTAAAGVRLVTIDRPGYGSSSPLPAGAIPSIPSYADDVAAVVAQLELEDVALAGWSAGGRIALAVAARHPDLVRAVAVVATPAPDDEVPWVPEEHRALSHAMKADPASATQTITDVFAQGGDPGEEAIGMISSGAADARVAADPACRARLVAMLAEGFRNGPAGVAADIVADQVVPWGFDVAAVGAPVAFFYGEDDAAVTPDHGRWYAARTAASTLTIVPEAGHLVVMTEWEAILAALR